MPIVGVVRELLVRYLDVWTPTALHARRAAFAAAGPAGAEVAEAALSVFAEFADRMKGRRLALLVVTPQVDGLAERLTAAQAELGTPAELSVHPVAGGPENRLAAALQVAGAAKAPLLAFIDSAAPPPADVTAAVLAGRPAELLLLTTSDGWAQSRAALRKAGFPLTAVVELVDMAGGGARLLAFATSHDKSLEAFKNEMWALDEYAGVRYRDPNDPEGHLIGLVKSAS